MNPHTLSDDEILAGLKEKELELLKIFIETCEKLNIRYYLMGGTLLGAVRHKGFIPWDDDIDVAMTRTDYNVWIKKAPALIKEKYVFLQTFHSDPQFPTNFAKLRNSNTTFIETSINKLDVNHGIYIDIFPLDYYPESSWKQFFFTLKQKLLTQKISTLFTRSHHTFKSRIKSIIVFFYPITPLNAVKSRDKLYQSISSSNLLANLSGAWGKKEIVPKSWYGKGAELEFEGLKVMGPKEWDKWLTQVYGDYMTMPPIDQRKPHHYSDAIDFNKPYTEYIHKEKRK